MIRNQPPERLTELARGIVRGDYLVADTSRDWVHSLSLLASEITKHKNLGLILVPLGPHMGGLWLNGKVPAITVSATPVNIGDTKRIQVIVNRMNAALFPDD